MLRRLVEQPDVLAGLACEALRVCPSPKDGSDLKPQCVQACHECPLSHRNQPESFLLDRRLIREVVRFLLNCRVEPYVHGVSRGEHLEQLCARTESGFKRQSLDFLAAGGYRLLEEAQKSSQEPRCIGNSFHEPNVLVFYDSAYPDRSDQR